MAYSTTQEGGRQRTGEVELKVGREYIYMNKPANERIMGRI